MKFKSLIALFLAFLTLAFVSCGDAEIATEPEEVAQPVAEVEEVEEATTEPATEEVEITEEVVAETPTEEKEETETGANKIPGPLKLRLKEGAEFRLEFTDKMSANQTMGDNELDVEVINTVGVLYKVVEVLGDGSYRIDITHEYCAIKTSRDGEEESLDSRDGDEIKGGMNPISSLLDTTIETVVSPNGTIESIKNTSELVDTILEKLQVPEQAREQVSEKLNDEFVIASLEKYFIALPKEEASEGCTWENESTLSVPFEMTTTSQYELSGIEDGKAKVDVKIEYSSDAEPEEQGPISVTQEISGSGTGTVNIDIATGMVASASYTTEYTLEMTISMEGQEEQTQEISIDNKITVKPYEKE